MSHRRIIVAALFGPALAGAQEVSDLNPPAPEASSSSGGAAQRLFPSINGAAGGGKGGAGAGDSTSGGAKGTGRAVLESEEVDNSSAPVEAVPEIHVVQKGDTLWALSSSYFRDPWYWPKLWSFNPLITNPHWIYPGDQLRLYPPGRSQPDLPAPVAAEALPERAQVTSSRSNRDTPATGIMLRQSGFVERGELDASGTIVGSKEEKILLSTLDDAYVQFHADRPLKPGERYTIYRTVSDVKHPVDGRNLGSIVEIMGEVEVRSVNDSHIARAVILDAVNPIERGYRVGPLRRQFKKVEPTPNRVNLDAIVVSALRQSEIVGSETLVFLDRGREDKVEVGNRFVVVRRGDGYTPILHEPEDDRRFPREVVAEVLVVDVRDRTASGIVTRSVKEIGVGDKLEARKGY